MRLWLILSKHAKLNPIWSSCSNSRFQDQWLSTICLFLMPVNTSIHCLMVNTSALKSTQAKDWTRLNCWVNSALESNYLVLKINNNLLVMSVTALKRVCVNSILIKRLIKYLFRSVDHSITIAVLIDRSNSCQLTRYSNYCDKMSNWIKLCTDTLAKTCYSSLMLILKTTTDRLMWCKDKY